MQIQKALSDFLTNVSYVKPVKRLIFGLQWLLSAECL